MRLSIHCYLWYLKIFIFSVRPGFLFYAQTENVHENRWMKVFGLRDEVTSWQLVTATCSWLFMWKLQSWVPVWELQRQNVLRRLSAAVVKQPLAGDVASSAPLKQKDFLVTQWLWGSRSLQHTWNNIKTPELFTNTHRQSSSSVFTGIFVPFIVCLMLVLLIYE